MGLNVFKWVYDLGVKHERHRIANLLRQAQAVRYEYADYSRNLDIGGPSNKSGDDIKVKLEVDKQMIGLIDSLFYTETEYVRGASKIFIKEDN